MTHALFVPRACDLPRNRPAISSKSDLNAPSLRPFAPTIATHASLQDLRCTVEASEIPIAPPDRRAHLPRFPSLAAFVRRPGSHRACCQLSDGAGIRNPSQVRKSRLALQPHLKCPKADRAVDTHDDSEWPCGKVAGPIRGAGRQTDTGGSSTLSWLSISFDDGVA